MHGNFRIPLVHEDEFDAGGERGDHGGVASGGVKQRHHQEQTLLRRSRIGRGHRLAPAQERARLAERTSQHGGGGIAMVPSAPFGFPLVPDV